MLAVLSIPIGVAVDALKISFRVQQTGFAVCAALIAASHAQLAAGGNPVTGVLGLGFGYAVSATGMGFTIWVQSSGLEVQG